MRHRDLASADLDIQRTAWSGAGVATVTCVDGSVLELRPVPVLARDDVPFEVTLELRRDGRPFGLVGERCAWLLTSAAARLRAAATGAPGQAPTTAVEAGVRRWAARTGADSDRTWAELDRYLPRDRELLALRSRDPDDGDGSGELRVEVRRARRWLPDGGATTGGSTGGRWAVEDTAVLDAWGDDGTGVRAVLPCDALLDLLDALLLEVAAAGTRTRGRATGSAARPARG